MAKEPVDSASRPRGRPTVEERGVPLTSWVKVSEYDKLCRLAQKRDQTVSSLVRSMLIVRLKP